jgi:hypothetical protein
MSSIIKESEDFCRKGRFLKNIHALDKFQELRDFWIKCFVNIHQKILYYSIDLSIKYTSTNKLGILEDTLTIII